MHMQCIVIDININQPHLFGYPQEHGEGHVISHHGTCIDWFIRTGYAGITEGKVENH